MTNIIHIHRWFTSVSQSFGQKLCCPYCKGNGLQHDNDYFVTCEFTIEREEVRMKAIIEKLDVILTTKEIFEGMCRERTNYYNNTKRKEDKKNNSNPIDIQEIIGWQHFFRERVSKKLMSAMKQHYIAHSGNPNFTGRG